MDHELIMIRWKLVYDEFERLGPWDGKADEYTDKASSYSKYGLRKAAIEIAADYEDIPLELLSLPGRSFEEFRWIATASFHRRQSKVVGLALIGKDFKVELFKDGAIEQYDKRNKRWIKRKSV